MSCCCVETSTQVRLLSLSGTVPSISPIGRPIQYSPSQRSNHDDSFVQLGCLYLPLKTMLGLRFGKLLVIATAPKKGRQKKWTCKCDCGNVTTPFAFSLKSGKSTSCGCIAANKAKTRWKEATPEMRSKQGEKGKTHGLSKHPAYQTWADMKNRCNNPNHKWFPSYGGRGITVCSEWLNSFESFWKDMGPTWSSGLSLGRIDNNDSYCIKNCRWETPTQQQNNRSVSVFIATPHGELTLAQAARLFGVSYECLRYRVNSGWPTEDFFNPSQRKT